MEAEKRNSQAAPTLNFEENEMNGCYIMSNGSMIATQDDFLGDLEIETRESEDPPAQLWAEAVARVLGYSVSDTFPVDFEGQGLAILYRSSHEKKEGQLPFQFLAILATSYDEDVMVGIPDVPDLLDFYAKVESMLMLRTSPRFRDVTDGKNGVSTLWDQGRQWRKIRDRREAYFIAHPDERPGQRRQQAAPTN
jgi:hypothetical protein